MEWLKSTFIIAAVLCGFDLLLTPAMALDFNIIYPGTKWCGTGNIASNYDDLGRLTSLDTCCRQHDHCPEKLDPGEERGGLTNTGLFPMFPCHCDETFRECLQSVGNIQANFIGKTYFNLLDNMCYEVSGDKLMRVKSNRFKPANS